jgi:hypothetical protein
VLQLPSAKPLLTHFLLPPPPLHKPAAFAAVQHPGANLMNAKLIFIALNLAGTGVFLWKLRGMGLLPVTSSDWVSLLPDRTAVEHSALESPVST